MVTEVKALRLQNSPAQAIIPTSKDKFTSFVRSDTTIANKGGRRAQNVPDITTSLHFKNILQTYKTLIENQIGSFNILPRIVSVSFSAPGALHLKSVSKPAAGVNVNSPKYILFSTK